MFLLWPKCFSNIAPGTPKKWLGMQVMEVALVRTAAVTIDSSVRGVDIDGSDNGRGISRCNDGNSWAG